MRKSLFIFLLVFALIEQIKTEDDIAKIKKAITDYTQQAEDAIKAKIPTQVFYAGVIAFCFFITFGIVGSGASFFIASSLLDPTRLSYCWLFVALTPISYKYAKIPYATIALACIAVLRYLLKY